MCGVAEVPDPAVKTNIYRAVQVLGHTHHKIYAADGRREVNETDSVMKVSGSWR